MSVRKTLGINQPITSSVKVITAGFDRFSRRFSGESHARGGVRFGEYTLLMTNMPPLTGPALTTAAPVSGVAR